jgi:hypothetical protein
MYALRTYKNYSSYLHHHDDMMKPNKWEKACIYGQLMKSTHGTHTNAAWTQYI